MMEIPDRTLINVQLPASCSVAVNQSETEPDIWHIVCKLIATDVEVGDQATFSTRWTGNKPSMEDVFKVVMIALRHEVAEQLGLDPHHKNIPKGVLE